MNLYVTPPLAHLELTELGSNNLYILAQLYKSSPLYKEYVHKAKAEGRYLILDNGAGDEGEVIQKEELFEMTKEIMPNEVIPTDVLYDCTKTIDNLEWFVDQLIKEELIDTVKIFACPQGRTFNKWMDCYYHFSFHSSVHTIGLSKKAIPQMMFGNLCKKDQGIAESRVALMHFLKQQDRMWKSMHFLGMGDPKEFLEYPEDNPLLLSTDSCYPILAAMNGINLRDDEFQRIPTPKDYFEREMTLSQIELAKDNINFVKECCRIL